MKRFEIRIEFFGISSFNSFDFFFFLLLDTLHKILCSSRFELVLFDVGFN